MSAQFGQKSVLFCSVSTIRVEKTNPFNPAPILNCAISNVICSIIMSTRFHHNDKKFKRSMRVFDEGFRLFNLTGAMIFIPVLKHLKDILVTSLTLSKGRDK